MLKKKVVLVTGCSSGLGKSLCDSLPKNEFYVVATARDLQKIENVQADLKWQVDVCKEEMIQPAICEIVKITGHIDILINNAGFSVRSAVEEMDVGVVQEMFDANVFGSIRMMQAVVPYMRQQAFGKIINIGSVSGRMTSTINGGYCASKYAMEAITEAARYELSEFGVQVSIMEPGAMKTDFFKTLEENSKKYMSNAQSPYSLFYEKDKEYRKKQSRVNVAIGAKRIIQIMQKKKMKTRYTISVPVIFRLYLHLPDWLKEITMKHFN